MSFVLVSDTLEYLDCLFTARLSDENGLETTLKSGILFNVLPVFLDCSCADNLHFAPCKSGLENICGVNRTLCGACTDKGVNLINEEDNVAGL